MDSPKHSTRALELLNLPLTSYILSLDGLQADSPSMASELFLIRNQATPPEECGLFQEIRGPWSLELIL